MTKEQELAKIMSLIEYYKEQLQNTELQSQYLQAAITDYYKAQMTLEQMHNTEKDTDMLIPIGGSTYINVSSKDTSKVLFDIGSGFVAEKSVDDAIKKIGERIENLQKNMEKLIETSQKLQNEAAELSQQAQMMMSESKE